MHKNNKNKTHSLGAMKAVFTGVVILVPCLVIAQGLPQLPPLPPLPGMEVNKPSPIKAPDKEVVELPSKVDVPSESVALSIPLPVNSEDEFEIPEVSSADSDIQMPDFGLFDPSSLPKETRETVENVANPVDEGSESEILDVLAADDIPNIPALPGFSEDEVAPDKIEKIANSNQDGSKKSDVVDIEPPKLPDEKPIEKSLSDALPSWMTDEALPTLKPLRQDRDLKGDEKIEDKTIKSAKKESVKKKSSKKDETLSDLVNKEINSGSDDDGKKSSKNKFAGEKIAKKKAVVWPRDFRTYTLPHQIYKKQYSDFNQHLPHALYQREIERHLFAAVAANDPNAIRALLRTGVPLSIRRPSGEGLVMHAVRTGASSSLQLLLAIGLKPNQQDRYRATPLHRAVFMGRQDMVTILLRSGADAHVKDISGITPMSIAVARNDQPMMQTLGYYQASSQARRISMVH